MLLAICYMKKRLEKVIGQTIHQFLVEYTISIGKSLVLTLFFLYVLNNIVLSQALSPTYYKLFSPNLLSSSEDRNTMVDFLRDIRDTDDYSYYRAMAVNTFGDGIEQEVDSEQYERTNKIVNLEDILKKNLNARDVLYELSILYKDQGEGDQASIYLERAKKVDPLVENK